MCTYIKHFQKKPVKIVFFFYFLSETNFLYFFFYLHIVFRLCLVPTSLTYIMRIKYEYKCIKCRKMNKNHRSN